VSATAETAITFTEQEHISAVLILLLSLAIGMPTFASAGIRFHTLLYSIVFYSANKAPCHFKSLLFCSARICALTRILAITALQKAAFSRSSASQFLLWSASSAMDVKGVRKP
jgi:hypothetical protein